MHGKTQDWVALGGCAAGALIISAGVGSVVAGGGGYSACASGPERDEARELLHSHSVGKVAYFCEKLAQQAGIDQSHPALQRWYAAILRNAKRRGIVGFVCASILQPVPGAPGATWSAVSPRDRL